MPTVDKKAMPDKYVLNPATGRYVLKTGKIGEKIQREAMKGKVSSVHSKYLSLENVMRHTGHIIPSKITRLDMLKLKLVKLKGIELKDDQGGILEYLPFLVPRVFPEVHDKFITGKYKNVTFAICERRIDKNIAITEYDDVHLVMHISSLFTVVQDLRDFVKGNRKSLICNIMEEQTHNVSPEYNHNLVKHLVSTTSDILTHMLGFSVKFASVKYSQFAKPLKYVKNKYRSIYKSSSEDTFVPPFALATSKIERGLIDPWFWSRKYPDIFYVFHFVNKNTTNVLPHSITVGRRESRQRKRYTRIARIYFDSDAQYYNHDLQELTGYVSELYNLFQSIEHQKGKGFALIEPYMKNFNGFEKYVTNPIFHIDCELKHEFEESVCKHQTVDL